MPTLDLQVSDNADDSYYRTNSGGTPSLSNNANDIMAGRFGDDEKAAGSQMRFLNVTIPQGATIDTAYLTLHSDNGNSSTTVNSKIRGVDADNATMATTTGGGAGSFENPPFTDAVVNWDNIGAWVNDVDYNSPEIKTIIQEIVDRVGWSSGNAIVIQWDDIDLRSTQMGTVIRTAAARDNGGAYGIANCAKLHIEYTEAEGGTVVQDIVGLDGVIPFAR
jgi:hypothetical protein